MTDCIIYPAVSHPPKRRWTWTIPTTIIVGGVLSAAYGQDIINRSRSHASRGRALLILCKP